MEAQSRNYKKNELHIYQLKVQPHRSIKNIDSSAHPFCSFDNANIAGTRRQMD